MTGLVRLARHRLLLPWLLLGGLASCQSMQSVGPSPAAGPDSSRLEADARSGVDHQEIRRRHLMVRRRLRRARH